METMHYSPTYRYKVLLLMAGTLAGGTMVAGTWMINNDPTFSVRGLTALIERPLYAYEFANAETHRSEKNATNIPILTYHRVVSDSSDVNNVTKSRFKDQMATLKRAGWETVTLEEFEQFMRGEITVPEKSFLITFDDAAKDSYYPVDPILDALGYEAVNFVIVHSSETPRTTYYLTPREIERMIASERWSIGSHSFDGHRPYPVDPMGTTGIYFADLIWDPFTNRLETEDEFKQRVRTDLTKAKDHLEETYGIPINSFAFPLGNETGIEGANNFPAGSSVTEEEVRGIYGFGYLQLNNQQFTTNVPQNTPLWRPFMDKFLAHRIHVDYDWDGARILGILEKSQPKQLPYEDDFTEDNGWIPAWGSTEVGRNNFKLTASDDGTSVSTFLDGSQFWDMYSFEANVSWPSGHIQVLGDVVDADTYHTCAFSPGLVRILSSINGETRELAQKRDNRIAYGDATVGIRVHHDVIECTWNFASIIESYSRDFAGGVGIQVWNSDHGSASLTVRSVIARPFEGVTGE